VLLLLTRSAVTEAWGGVYVLWAFKLRHRESATRGRAAALLPPLLSCGCVLFVTSIGCEEPVRSTAVVALMSICSLMDELYQRAEKPDLTVDAIREMCADNVARAPQGPWARALLEADALAVSIQVRPCVAERGTRHSRHGATSLSVANVVFVVVRLVCPLTPLSMCVVRYFSTSRYF
jgi:hypothetical protein